MVMKNNLPFIVQKKNADIHKVYRKINKTFFISLMNIAMKNYSFSKIQLLQIYSYSKKQTKTRKIIIRYLLELKKKLIYSSIIHFFTSFKLHFGLI